jgi:hypothetical protein
MLELNPASGAVDIGRAGFDRRFDGHRVERTQQFKNITP